VSVLDEKPFIVMPYLKHGNVRDFIQNHPQGNRDMIVSKAYLTHVTVLIVNRQLHHIAIGVAHLYSKNIVHGDIKVVSNLCSLATWSQSYNNNEPDERTH
jgi:serine/threonine protein kinase